MQREGGVDLTDDSVSQAWRRQDARPLDAALARTTYLHALDAASITGSPLNGRGVLEVAEAAQAAPAPPGAPRPVDLLLDGLVTTFTQGYGAGARAAPGAGGVPRPRAHAEAVGDSDSRRWLWLASRTAVTLFDDELLYVLASRNESLA